MADDTIVGLVKDLTFRLSSIANEFGMRADQLSSTNQDSPEPGSRPSRRKLAEHILKRRQARHDHFPAELFHEPAWDMLLALYIANDEGRVMNVKSLVASSCAPVTTSQRWIEHLHKLKLVHRVIDPDDRRRIEVSLSENGESAISDYLDRIAAY